MKDTSRPPPTRAAPYRKRTSDNASPVRNSGARWPYDASQPQPPGQGRELISPSDRAQSSRRDEAQTSRPAVMNPSADGERRRTAGNRAISHTRRHTSADESARGTRFSHTSALSTHADVPGPSLRLPLTSAPPTSSTFKGRNGAESPSPGSVTAFLRSIELPDKPSSAPPHQRSFSLNNPPLRLPLSTDKTDKTARTSGSGYQIALIYKGYTFDYDLAALPDDPKSAIALLNITKSDPGAYFLVGAHYRRTGRSRAASTVIRSLLDNLDTPSEVEKGKGDAIPPHSATSSVTLVSPGSPCSKPVDCSRPVVKSAAMRPAMLLLAACELDISRERPDDPKSASHASTAYHLFRAVYGTVNDAIVAGAARPEPKNALGLDIKENGSASDSNGRPPPATPSNTQPPREAESTARVKDLEKELSAARAAHKKLQERLSTSNDRLARAEDKVYVLESRSREVHAQLNASRDENWELRRRLAEREQREREMAQYAPHDGRVWGRIKGLFFDNLGSGLRGA